MTTRRTILRGIAALPAVVAPAALAATTNSDVALIAFAAAVEALAVQSHAAVKRRCDLEAKYEDIKLSSSAKPLKPVAADRSQCTREDGPDGSMTIRYVPAVPDPAEAERERRYAKALRVWEAKKAAIREELGLTAAEDAFDHIYDRLEDAARELTPMAPTTLSGLAAKARAAVMLDPHDDHGLNDWEHDLRASVLHDLVAFGGAA